MFGSTSVFTMNVVTTGVVANRQPAFLYFRSQLLFYFFLLIHLYFVCTAPGASENTATNSACLPSHALPAGAVPELRLFKIKACVWSTIFVLWCFLTKQSGNHAEYNYFFSRCLNFNTMELAKQFCVYMCRRDLFSLGNPTISKAVAQIVWLTKQGVSRNPANCSTIWIQIDYHLFCW